MPALLPAELPELARTRHHWVTLLRPPRKGAALALLALVVWAAFAHAVGVIVVLLLLVVGFLRWQTWRAELIILTRRRIVRVRGVPETTSSEASLRIDRVSGARLVQTVPGKLLDYATIELEAPGDHPDVRRLVTIARPHAFYAQLRRVLFSGPGLFLDPDTGAEGGAPALVVPGALLPGPRFPEAPPGPLPPPGQLPPRGPFDRPFEAVTQRLPVIPPPSPRTRRARHRRR